MILSSFSSTLYQHIGRVFRKAAVPAILVSGSACQPSVTQEDPGILEKLEQQGVVIVDTFSTPGGLKAWAAYLQGEPIAFYVTPDGKHLIAGTLIDSNGVDVNRNVLEQTVMKSMRGNIWDKVEQSHWIADGEDSAPRKVYVFTDVNCGFCNRLWVEARPWVESGKVQLRHIMVGIIRENSVGKAATVLADSNPTRRLAAHATYVTSGRPDGLKAGEIASMDVIPAEIQSQISSHHALMASLGLQATPAMVWIDDAGIVQTRTGAPPQTLLEAFGER